MVEIMGMMVYCAGYTAMEVYMSYMGGQHERDRPLTAEQIKSCSAAQSMFRGLFAEYPKALKEGRLKQWREAGKFICQRCKDALHELHNAPLMGAATGGKDEY